LLRQNPDKNSVGTAKPFLINNLDTRREFGGWNQNLDHRREADLNKDNEEEKEGEEEEEEKEVGSLEKRLSKNYLDTIDANDHRDTEIHFPISVPIYVITFMLSI
jgi:hypothetical protein